MFVDMTKFVCSSVELVDAKLVVFVFTVVQITKIWNLCFGHPLDTNHCKEKLQNYNLRRLHTSSTLLQTNFTISTNISNTKFNVLKFFIYVFALALVHLLVLLCEYKWKFSFEWHRRHKGFIAADRCRRTDASSRRSVKLYKLFTRVSTLWHVLAHWLQRVTKLFPNESLHVNKLIPKVT